MSLEQTSNKIGKSVGERLRSARIAQHYTQSQLAAPDFSVSYISAIERGQIHPSLRALEILATRLGMSSTQLLPMRSQNDDRFSNLADLNERDEDEVAFVFLEAQLTILNGDALAALAEINQLNPKRLQRRQQLQHRYLQGYAHYEQHQYQEAEYLLIEAEQIASELQVNYLQQRIVNLLALTYAGIRNYAQALQTHQRCLALLEEQEEPDPFFTMQIYISMGQHYTRLDNIEQALDVYHKALVIANELQTPQDIQKVYSRLCTYYAFLNEQDLATLYAYKSTQLHNQTMMKRLRSELYHYLGHVLMREDDQQAYAFIEEALHNPSVLQDSLTYASILTRAAEWSLDHNDLSQATAYAQQAYELTQHANDTIIAAEALIIRGRIAYMQQQYDEGSKLYVAGLDMLERLNSHEELADESVRYAQLLEEAGREREAFTHFRRAFQSRQKIGK